MTTERLPNLTTTRLKGAEINLWTLRFADWDIERGFRESTVQAVIGQIRIWLLCAFFCQLLYGVIGLFVLAEGREFAAWIRFAYISPALLLSNLAIRSSYFSRWYGAILTGATAMTLSGSFLMAAFIPFPTAWAFFAELFIITAFANAFIHMRLLYSSILTVFALFGLGLFLGFAPRTIMQEEYFAASVFVLTLLAGTGGLYFREISQRRTYRLALILNKQRTQADRLAERALAASQAKSRFLAMMSHELRTPLNSIIGFAEIMEHKIFGEVLPNRYASYISDIAGSGRHLLEVINAILDISKAESGKLRAKMASLRASELIVQVMRMMQEQAHQAGVQLHADDKNSELQVMVDERMLCQILLNLVSNALKFTPANGTVTLSVGEGEPGMAYIAVHDTGVGIPAEQIPVALELFGQVDNDLNRRYQGSGLGLPLAKVLTEIHGGRLDLQSQPGVGTSVTIWLPKAPSPADLEMSSKKVAANEPGAAFNPSNPSAQAFLKSIA